MARKSWYSWSPALPRGQQRGGGKQENNPLSLSDAQLGIWFAQTIDEFTVGRREIVVEAVDRFDDDAPLRESRDCAQRVETSLHFDRYADAELRVVLDLLTFSGAGWRAADAPTFSWGFEYHGNGRVFSYGCVCAINNPPI